MDPMKALDSHLLRTGVGFTVGGILFAYCIWRLVDYVSRDNRVARPIRVLSKLTIVVVVVCSGAYLYLTLPSLEDRQRRFDRAFHSPPADIHAVVLDPRYPSADPRVARNLVESQLRVMDRERIRGVLQALTTARPFRPNHPQSHWACRMTLQFEAGELTFEEVTNTTSNTNGVLIAFRYGWLRESYRCDALGDVLEKIVNK